MIAAVFTPLYHQPIFAALIFTYVFVLLAAALVMLFRAGRERALPLRARPADLLGGGRRAGGGVHAGRVPALRRARDPAGRHRPHPGLPLRPLAVDPALPADRPLRARGASDAADRALLLAGRHPLGAGLPRPRPLLPALGRRGARPLLDLRSGAREARAADLAALSARALRPRARGRRAARQARPHARRWTR